MNKQTRKEHLVPRTHLKNFSYKNKNTDKVLVFDKKKNKSYRCSVDDVGCQKDFYEVSNKETNYWENWYGKIETNIPNIYNSVIINSRFSTNGKKVLSYYLKRELAIIIISQMLRTETAKKYFLSLGFGITSNMIDNIKRLLGNTLNQEQIKMLDKYRRNDDFVYSEALEHLNSAIFMKKAINILLNKSWVVHKNLNYKQLPFITCDSPVILYNFYTHELGFGFNGLMKKGTIIYFAINKELLIAIYPANKDFKKCNNTIDFMDDNKFVKKFNELNYRQCERHVFL